MMKRLFQIIERRFFSRYPVQLPIAFSVVKVATARDITESHDGTVVNLSKKGCSVEVDKLSVDGFHLVKFLEETDCYRLRMVFQGGKSELLGMIRWINSDTEGKWQVFKIGIEFVTPITKEDVKSLISGSKDQPDEV